MDSGQAWPELCHGKLGQREGEDLRARWRGEGVGGSAWVHFPPSGVAGIEGAQMACVESLRWLHLPPRSPYALPNPSPLYLFLSPLFFHHLSTVLLLTHTLMTADDDYGCYCCCLCCDCCCYVTVASVYCVTLPLQRDGPGVPVSFQGI